MFELGTANCWLGTVQVLLATCPPPRDLSRSGVFHALAIFHVGVCVNAMP
jgi:hypothetical protein